MLSPAMEDYLKTIYLIEQKHGTATTSMLAEQMGITAASVTGMIKKLNTLEMVAYEPYRGVRLTTAGKLAALETLRHHRLLELFLTEQLGFGWDEVHEEADRLEHHISEAVEARLFELLGRPTHDPHGDPIPTLSGDLPTLNVQSLTELPPGTTSVLARVLTQDDEVLRYLRGVGLVLNTTLTVLNVERIGGTMTLRLDDNDVTISLDVARWMQVVPVE